MSIYIKMKLIKQFDFNVNCSVGIFVICWLPFFITALLMPLCEACSPSMFVFSIFQWLGYLNSLLNPIIYTIFR